MSPIFLWLTKKTWHKWIIIIFSSPCCWLVLWGSMVIDEGDQGLIRLGIWKVIRWMGKRTQGKTIFVQRFWSLEKTPVQVGHTPNRQPLENYEVAVTWLTEERPGWTENRWHVYEVNNQYCVTSIPKEAIELNTPQKMPATPLCLMTTVPGSPLPPNCVRSHVPISPQMQAQSEMRKTEQHLKDTELNLHRLLTFLDLTIV